MPASLAPPSVPTLLTRSTSLFCCRSYLCS